MRIAQNSNQIRPWSHFTATKLFISLRSRQPQKYMQRKNRKRRYLEYVIWLSVQVIRQSRLPVCNWSLLCSITMDTAYICISLTRGKRSKRHVSGHSFQSLRQLNLFWQFSEQWKLNAEISDLMRHFYWRKKHGKYCNAASTGHAGEHRHQGHQYQSKDSLYTYHVYGMKIT
jgi:hypothetical protein